MIVTLNIRREKIVFEKGKTERQDLQVMLGFVFDFDSLNCITYSLFSPSDSQALQAEGKVWTCEFEEWPELQLCCIRLKLPSIYLEWEERRMKQIGKVWKGGGITTVYRLDFHSKAVILWTVGNFLYQTQVPVSLSGPLSSLFLKNFLQ